MHVLSRSCATLVLGAVAACGPVRPVPLPVTPDGGLLYTAADIAKMQVSTAWDVVERSGRMNLEVSPDGRSAAIRNRQGKTSILLPSADMPVLIVDGVRLDDPRVLRGINAGSIERLRMIDGAHATLTQGTNSTGGLIDITTKATPDSI